MDNAGRISQAEYHSAIDRRDKRIAQLESEKDAAMRKLAASMGEVSYGSFSQVVDLASSALTHWHKMVKNPDLQKYL